MSIRKTWARAVSSLVPVKRHRHLVRELLLSDDVTGLLSRKKIRLFYHLENFGDVINVNLMKYFDVDIVRMPAVSFADMCCIGSNLEYCLKRYEGDIRQKPIHIFGSGFMRAADNENEQFCRPVHIHALRGRLSRIRCEKMLGQSLSQVVLGDPGLLIGRMFPKVEKTAKYDVGIICHYVDQGSPLIRRINMREMTCRIISVLEDPAVFVSKVAECSFIFSSALHGLICADSLGVPNRHVILSNRLVGGTYKFRDYYSAFRNAPYHPVDLNRKEINEEDVERLQAEYRITGEEVNAICNRLVQAFPYRGKLSVS